MIIQIALKENILPWRIKVWLVSSKISQPSTIVLSMARFFRMFSVSLTSSCITLSDTIKMHFKFPEIYLAPAVTIFTCTYSVYAQKVPNVPCHKTDIHAVHDYSCQFLFFPPFKSLLQSFSFFSSRTYFARVVFRLFLNTPGRCHQAKNSSQLLEECFWISNKRVYHKTGSVFQFSVLVI